MLNSTEHVLRVLITVSLFGAACRQVTMECLLSLLPLTVADLQDK